MTDLQTISTRPDMDIHEDVIRIILTYPPLANDRHHIDVAVENGIVTLRGNTMTPINRVYLEEHVAGLPGVHGVHAQHLADDETLRLDIGRLLPAGVIANVRYGAVVLSGTLPADTTVNELGERVVVMPGVNKVVTNFDAA